ncbi:hypothetical protein DPMN_183550 [Dreissena polymorpha]|uniref:Uncharacterized protein n=1 Tax=Dreissena polymorpha TaxID=45954 RepID=A0A9D4DIK6_DREPO|nr:hypothetical protein DPMN_183550 [Dreissena polymorpha]
MELHILSGERSKSSYKGYQIWVKAQSHYDAGGAPVRDPGSTGMNRGSTGMNRGSTGDDQNEPGKTGAPLGKY